MPRSVLGFETITPFRRHAISNRVFGALFCAAGLGIIALATADPGSVNGPPWLGLVAGGLFAVAGLTVVLQDTAIAPWAGPIGAGLILAGFAAIGSWIAFGAGPRQCSGGISFFFVSVGGRTGEIECRVAFGLGAVLVDALLVAMLAGGLAKLLPDRGWPRKLKKASEWLIWIALAPILIPLLLWAAGKSAWGAMRERRRASR